MTTKYEAGQTVYSETGEQAEYVAQAGDGHIVRPVVEAYSEYVEDGPYDHVCDPTMWRKVFPEPPVAKFSGELKALHEQIAAANQQLRTVRDEQRQADASQKDRLARLSKIEQLRYIEDFLDGKLTHYAVFPDYDRTPLILKASEAFCEVDGRGGKMRLFCLYGDQKDRTLKWQLHRYSDSSGDMTNGEYFPARSEEEAKAIILHELSSRVTKANAGGSYVASLVDSAVKWGVLVPQPLLDEAGRVKAAARCQSVMAARRDLERAQDRLIELGESSAA